MSISASDLPFDGAISRYFLQEAPAVIRADIQNAAKHEILAPDFPYETEWDAKAYNKVIEDLQVELVKLVASAKARGTRIDRSAATSR